MAALNRMLGVLWLCVLLLLASRSEAFSLHQSGFGRHVVSNNDRIDPRMNHLMGKRILPGSVQYTRQSQFRNKNNNNNSPTQLLALLDIVGTSPEPIHTAFSIATFGPQPFWLLLILAPKTDITKKIMGGMGRSLISRVLFPDWHSLFLQN